MTNISFIETQHSIQHIVSNMCMCMCMFFYKEEMTMF
jgi:hypothetical protein